MKAIIGIVVLLILAGCTNSDNVHKRHAFNQSLKVCMQIGGSLQFVPSPINNYVTVRCIQGNDPIENAYTPHIH